MNEVKLGAFRRFLTLFLGLILSVGVYAQNITVKGHVKDTAGFEVIGANVVEKGNPTNGVVTDLDGNFVLTVPAGATLSISFIGYVTQEVSAAPEVVVTLQDDSQMLEQVIVIGYGTAKKNDLTGSVTAIKPDEMNRGLVTNAQDMMAGKIAGVNVTSDGGTPGGGSTIRIRGGASLSASNDPLIVIDGLAMDNSGVQGLSNPLAMVNPNDIESFTVLKDASATAIYGSRASNGVIIITTKKGSKSGKIRLAYNGNVSASTIKNRLEVMDGMSTALSSTICMAKAVIRLHIWAVLIPTGKTKSTARLSVPTTTLLLRATSLACHSVLLWVTPIRKVSSRLPTSSVTLLQ